MGRLFLTLGGILSLLGVALGAFGAHALKEHLSPKMMGIYHTAVQYQLWHALGLILVGLLLQGYPQLTLLKPVGWLLVAGIILFSGSLYLLSGTGLAAMGAVTPLGGLCFLAGWLLFAYACWTGLKG